MPDRPALSPERKHLQAGETLFRQDQPVRAVYPLRHGGIKRMYESALGWRQLTGFMLPGDVAGLEPNDAPQFGTSAIALQASECCVVPLETAKRCEEDPAVHAALLALLHRDALRQRELLVTIGSMKAAQRLAMLLLDQAAEHRRRGTDGGEVMLAMTRNDIASYLGLTLETVSRLLSRFASVGLITVRHRQLRIVDEKGLSDVHAEADRITLRGPDPA
ncbi:helix-turn-helix domain-containing protein [Cupriavidus metallidurans]|uniref:Crp/Fnr family transcriptional regulator n=1 Tax=Cupriavidus TaxID=106589 RepID=UPI000E7E9227|nr:MULTISPECIES: helix-turn-helix domain-containing protein [Cupriavidus]GMG93156.1 transcriptional regulatory protein btr [Cupriavidus sp. TKC]HBD34487.1 Crp/Fnr family transcriptional regulator [Cupriavidus sp.]